MPSATELASGFSAARGQGRSVALVALCGIAPSGCGGELPPIVWEGEHVRVGTELELEDWCPSNLTRLDEYVGATKELFGTRDDLTLEYFLVESPVSDYAPCGDAAACRLGSQVFTQWLPHDHEIVHALGSGMRRGFFEEGRASYFGDAYPNEWADADGLDARAFIESWSHAEPRGRYRLAAHFTAYLVDTYGVEAYLELDRASDRDQSQAAFAEAFERVLGVALDRAVDEYESAWPKACGPSAPRSLAFECAQDPIAITADEDVVFDLDLSCAGPGVLGPRPDALGVPRTWRDITVEHDGHLGGFVLFEAPAPGVGGTVVVEILPCSNDCVVREAESRVFRPPENPDVWGGHPYQPEAGRYVMRVSVEADAVQPVRIRWR